MDSKFLNLSVGDWREVMIHTLGPSGTSSEAAAGFFTEWLGQRFPESQVQINLSDSYEHACSAMDERPWPLERGSRGGSTRGGLQ